MASKIILISSFLLVSLLSLAFHVIFNSPISPLPLSLPSSSSSSHFTSNNILQTIEKMGEGKLLGPEDVLVHTDGLLYTATRDGWIMRMQLNGSGLDEWKFIGGSGVLGITGSSDGSLLVCDVAKGLLKVADEGITVLAATVDDGSLIRLADAAIEASDGTIYFSDASTKFGVSAFFLDFLEARPHGRLLKYDPSTKATSIVLSDLAFANGVALSQNQDFLVVCETWRFRCLKYWLKGDNIGKSEIFINNLPGGPDNINLAPDGTYWISVLQMNMGTTFRLMHQSAMAKRIVATFAKLLEKMNPMKKAAMAIKVAENGTVMKMFDDSDGSAMSFVTSAVEYDGFLYLGNLGTNFIGKLSL